MHDGYVVVIWSSEDLVSDVLCYAMCRLGYVCQRVCDIADVAVRLPADTTRLILVVLPQVERAVAVACCTELQQQYTVIPIFLTDGTDEPRMNDLPPGAVLHPHPIELKQFHQLLQQLIVR